MLYMFAKQFLISEGSVGPKYCLLQCETIFQYRLICKDNLEVTIDIKIAFQSLH